jgi:hypothetical protein
MSGSSFFRKAGVVSDVRPPPPPGTPTALGVCTRCGEPVLHGEGLDRVLGEGAREGLQHFVCDAHLRDAAMRKIEAVRSLHRAIAALAPLREVQAALASDVAGMPDVVEIGDVLAVLERTRTSVECTTIAQPEKRRLALSYLDTVLRKLRG